MSISDAIAIEHILQVIPRISQTDTLYTIHEIAI